MPNPPLDLVEYTGKPPFADFKPVSMDDYIKQFRKRWVLRTSIGDVVLKKLGQLDRDRISVDFFDKKPELLTVLREVERLKEFERRGIPLSPANEKKMEDAGRLLVEQQRLFTMACIESPKLSTLEEYDAFLTALESDEVTKLYEVLLELVSIRPATASCEALLSMSKEYGIRIAEDLTLENMTAEQATILTVTADKRAEAMKAEVERAINAK